MAFEKIKKYLSSPLVLKAPKRVIPFRLYVAAEDKVIGAVLTQKTEGKEYIILLSHILAGGLLIQK